MTIRCERVRELAPGFVLGALDAADMAAVHEHLIGCREPHPELREFGGVLPYLAATLEPVEPPARLRAAVIAAAQADLAAHPWNAQAAAPSVSPKAAKANSEFRPKPNAKMFNCGSVRPISPRINVASNSDVTAGAALGFWAGRKVDRVERGQVRLFDRARFLFRGSPRKFQVGFKTRF